MESERGRMEKKFEDVRQLRSFLKELSEEGKVAIEEILSSSIFSDNDSISNIDAAKERYKKNNLEHIEEFDHLYNDAANDFILDKGRKMMMLFDKAVMVRNLEEEIPAQLEEKLGEEEGIKDDESFDDEELEKMISAHEKLVSNNPDYELIQVFSWLTDGQMKRWQDVLIKIGLMNLN